MVIGLPLIIIMLLGLLIVGFLLLITGLRSIIRREMPRKKWLIALKVIAGVLLILISVLPPLFVNSAALDKDKYNGSLQGVVQKGDYEKALSLLQSGANPNTIYYSMHCSYDDSPLICAIKGSNQTQKTEMVILLLQYGANINYQTEFGKTALIIACERRDYEMAELLVKNGADISIRDKSGKIANDYAEDVRIQELLK